MVDSGCSSCGGTATGGEVIYGAPAAGAVGGSSTRVEGSSTRVEGSSSRNSAPVITTEPAAKAVEAVIEAPTGKNIQVPSVDPNAFINRSGNSRG